VLCEFGSRFARREGSGWAVRHSSCELNSDLHWRDRNKRKRQAEEEALASKRARKAEAVKAASGPDPFGSAPLLAPSLGDALDAGGKEEGSGGGGLFGREIERRKKQEKQGVDSDEDVPMLAGAVQK